MNQVLISPPYYLDNVIEYKDAKETNSKAVTHVRKIVSNAGPISVKLLSLLTTRGPPKALCSSSPMQKQVTDKARITNYRRPT